MDEELEDEREFDEISELNEAFVDMNEWCEEEEEEEEEAVLLLLLVVLVVRLAVTFAEDEEHE